MLSQDATGSIVDDRGRVFFYSADRFVKEIVEDDRCFVCGTPRASSAFNDEHVIPDWLLRRHRLHDCRVTIPGGTEIKYSRYKIPCCEKCNSLMARRYEEPISRAFAGGYAAAIDLCKEHPFLLYSWMNLLFLKTHLKDRELLLDPDRRAGAPRVSDLYEWPEIHHIHCIARAAYTEVVLSDNALGSTLIFPAKTDSPCGDFDYADYWPGRAVMLRSGEIAIFCVLNDCCCTMNMLWPDLKRLAGRLGAAQCRELLAHFAYANQLIKQRPRFYTTIAQDGKRFEICAVVPDEWDWAEYSAGEFGHIAYSVLSSLFCGPPPANPEKDILEIIRRGRWTYLFKPDGAFNKDSI
jgi:hypothetical protein